MSPGETGRRFAVQTGALISVAALVSVPVRYVNPHSAVGNSADCDT